MGDININLSFRGPNYYPLDAAAYNDFGQFIRGISTDFGLTGDERMRLDLRIVPPPQAGRDEPDEDDINRAFRQQRQLRALPPAGSWVVGRLREGEWILCARACWLLLANHWACAWACLYLLASLLCWPLVQNRFKS